MKGQHVHHKAKNPRKKRGGGLGQHETNPKGPQYGQTIEGYVEEEPHNACKAGDNFEEDEQL